MVGKCILWQENELVLWKTNVTVMHYGMGPLKVGGFINCFNSPPHVLLRFPRMLGLASLQYCLLFE